MKPIQCQSMNTVCLQQQVNFFVFNFFCTIYLSIKCLVFFRIKFGFAVIDSAPRPLRSKSHSQGFRQRGPCFQHWNKLPNAFRLAFRLSFLIFSDLYFSFTPYIMFLSSALFPFPVVLKGTMEILFIYNSLPAEVPLSKLENHSFEM